MDINERIDETISLKIITTLGIAACGTMFLFACIPISGLMLTVAKWLFFIYVIAFLFYVVIKWRSKNRPFFDRNFGRLFILAIALFMLKEYAIRQEYSFGTDDAFYYSYLPSIILDGDLDFRDEFQRSGMPSHFFTRTTPTGLLKNEYPIGSAIFWAPFFLFGHLLSILLNVFGHHTFAADGYNSTSVNSVIAGNIFYCVLGIYFAYRVCAKYFSDAIALAAPVAIWLATSIYVYSTNVFLVSETLAMFSAALLLFVTLEFSKKFTSLKAFALGITSALCILVRLHNLVFLIIPVSSIVYFLFNENPRPTLKESTRLLLAYSAGLLIILLPQLIVWKLLDGSWIMDSGQYLPWWKSPRVLEVLFSARKGLFPWTPIVFVSFLGLILFLKIDRSLALVTLIVLGLNIYVNSSQLDWWGATAFGARRFTNCFVIFAVGFASFFSWAASRFGKTGIVVGFLIIAMFWNLNMFLTRSYRRGRLQYDHADRFSDVLATKHYKIFLPIVYGLQFPVQYYYHLKFGLPFYGPENEFFIGDDILYFQSKHGNLVSGASNPIFGKGWENQEIQTAEGTARLTNSSESIILLPMFIKNQNDLHMEMFLRSRDKNNSKVWVDLFLNERLITSNQVGLKGKSIRVNLLRYPYRKSVNFLRLRIYSKTTLEGNLKPPVLALESLIFF